MGRGDVWMVPVADRVVDAVWLLKPLDVRAAGRGCTRASHSRRVTFAVVGYIVVQ